MLRSKAGQVAGKVDWRQAESRLLEQVDLSKIPLIAMKRIQGELHLHVACSAGADSVFALLLVSAIRRGQREGELSILHFDHALRGAASREDAAFVRGVAAGLGRAFARDTAAWSLPKDRVSEAMAREARLGFFRCETEAQPGRASWVVTGHHADDVIETMLMRLSRGSGISGLCAPRVESDAGGGLRFLRPLLGYSREEIQQNLTAAGIPWREDESNRLDSNYRARLRSSVIPSWKRVADRPLAPGVLRSRRLLEEDSEALAAWADRLWAERKGYSDCGISRSVLVELPRAVQRRLIHYLPGVSQASASLLEEVLEALDSEALASWSLGRDRSLVLSDSQLCISRAEFATVASWPGFRLPMGCRAYLPDGSQLGLSLQEDLSGLFEGGALRGNDDNSSAWVSEGGNLLGGVRVRVRQNGDAFKPMGKTSEKKLKDLLIEKKVSRELRDTLPVFVCEGSEITWVPGLPPSASHALAPGSKRAFRLTYLRGRPT